MNGLSGSLKPTLAVMPLLVSLLNGLPPREGGMFSERLV